MPARSSSFNIAFLFDRAANLRRQTVIHIDKPLDIAPDVGTVLNMPTLATLVGETAGWLHAAGLRHGDRLAIVKDNHLDMFLIAAGAAWIGALPVLVSAANSTEAIGTLTGRIGPSVVVAGTGVLSKAADDGAAIAGPGTPVIAVGKATDGLPGRALTLDDLRGAAPPPQRPSADDEPMIVTHTSGTTGLPKLVVHSANTGLRWIPPRLERSRLPFLTPGPRDVVVAALPFAHIRSVCWVTSQVTVAPRAMVAISDPSLPNVERMLDAHRPTCLETLPNVFQRWEELADRQPELFAQVRIFTSTFDAIHPRTICKFINATQTRFPVWGAALAQSESSSLIATVVTRGMVRGRRGLRPESVGAGWPTLVRARVVDPSTGRKRGRKEPGLLQVATRARCLTYLGEEERFRAKVEGKWWNTGDIAESLGFGRFRMLDREVDMIPGTSGIELESILLDRLDRAAEVIVLAMPDGPPVPVLCMRDNQLEPGEWERAAQGLPQLGEPHLVPWDKIPRTGTWKVRRTQLRGDLFGAKAGLGTGAWT
jgi:acyl-coenzyme A synthetase/AMP-(fatty) acid ligase